MNYWIRDGLTDLATSDLHPNVAALVEPPPFAL